MKNKGLAVGLILVVVMVYAGLALATDQSHSEHCKGAGSAICGQAGSSHDGQGKHAGHDMHRGHGASAEKLGWEGMSKHVIPMTKTMSEMTDMLAVTMEKGVAPEKMKQLAGIMDALSTQMTRMSDIMNNGGATEEEMHVLHMSINDTEKQLKAMR